MGFCTEAQARTFLDQRQGSSGTDRRGHIALQILADLRQEKQEERFAERLNDPLKRWKLSPIDLERAGNMTPTPRRASDAEGDASEHAPWTLVDFNDQRRAAHPDPRPARPPARHKAAGSCDRLSAAAGQAEEGEVRRARADPCIPAEADA